MLRFFLLFIACFAFFIPLYSGADEPARKEKKVLFIGLDGLRPDAMARAKTPNLDALIAAGSFADDCKIQGERYQKSDTISGPGWSSILTGVWADKHGVNDNSFKGKDYEAYPCFFTLLKKQNPDARTISIAAWPQVNEHIVTDANEEITISDKPKDSARFDNEGTDVAVKELANSSLDCLFLYLGSTDTTGHSYGFHPTVPQYIAAIERSDANIGKALAAMKARKTYDDEDWLVVVTSDHGGRGKGHSGGRDIPEIHNTLMIVSGNSAIQGKFPSQTYIVDAPVTALTHLGVELDPKWKLDGKPVGLRGQ
jgi:predicted AlkP superfamily pyrophosphatase or phosphodiesterase